MRMRILLALATMLSSAGLPGVSLSAAQRGAAVVDPSTAVLLFCCDATNDVYQAVRQTWLHAGSQQLQLQRTGAHNCTTAARSLPNGSGVLLLADDAPAEPVEVPDGLLQLLETKYIRLYLEFAVPTSASAMPFFGATGRTPCPQFNRLVATDSDFWAGDANVQKLDVLEPNACYYMPYWAEYYGPYVPMQSHLVLAKVAGFTTATFGLDNLTVRTPALMTPPHHPGLLLAALPLSHVRRGRYSPVRSWVGLWKDVLRWLSFAESRAQQYQSWIDSLRWTAVVGPSFDRDAKLPITAAKDAVRRSLKWVHTRSGLLATQGALETSTALAVWTQGLLKGGWPSELASLGGQWNSDGLAGDGSAGIFENFLSSIQPRSGKRLGGPLSTQLVRTVVRSDCVGEAAGGLAVGAWAEFDDPKATLVASNLLDYLFFNSTAQAAWPRNDPSSAVGGTLLWAINIPPPHAFEIYADDQSRIAMAVAFAGSTMASQRWDIPLLHLLLGNVRLMNSAGYFHTSIEGDAVVRAGWKLYGIPQSNWYFDDDSHNENNYYQSAGRAAMLMAHMLTGDQTGLFLNRTRAGLRTTMASFYNHTWTCQVGLTSAAARVLLPLAWLVRVEDRAEYRKYIVDVAAVLLDRQQPCGAIHDWPFGFNSSNGQPQQCNHRPPQSNQEYGTGESTMQQTASDPASDLLYSNNFALHSLHEAAAATGDQKLHAAAQNLRDFVLRTQVAVNAKGFDADDVERALRLDGAWLRSFDFVAWEHFAQASDWQWGPWVAETGHGSSLLTMTIAVMERNSSMWETIAGEQPGRLSRMFGELRVLYGV